MRAHTAPRRKKTQNARATAETQPTPLRVPSQIAPNVQRAHNVALIVRRRGRRFPHCL